MSLKMTLRRALASDTFILSMVNLSSPRSSVLETMRGIYLDTAGAEWNGAADASDADADAMLSLNNNKGMVYIILVKQLDYNQFYCCQYLSVYTRQNSHKVLSMI
jgi:hypothetical protein